MNTKRYKQAFAATLAALIAFPPFGVAPLYAQAAGSAVAVEGLQVTDDKVVIQLSEEAQYKSFMTANPPRLVVEIVGAEYQAGAKSFAGKGKLLKGVRGAQFKPKPDPVSRVVLDLDKTTTYTVAQEGKNLVVTLAAAKDSGSAPAPAVTQAEGAPKAPASPSPAKSEPAKPAAKPAPVKTPVAAKPKVEPKPQVAQVAPVSKEAEKPGSMVSENNPELQAMAVKKDASKTESDVPPPPPAPRAAPERTTASRGGGDILARLPRDTVTLDFDNTDIRDVIKLLAAKANLNIIYGPDVAGTLSLHLQDVPFNEAFRTILTMMGLQTMQVGDSILRILTPAALAKSQTSAATSTRVMPLNYATASEIIATVNQVRTAEGRAGMAIADVKTNSLIVTESLEGLTATERLVRELDQRPKQVLIEAKLVEVGLNNSLHYGIQWDATGYEPGKIGGKQGINTLGTTAGSAGGTTLSNPLDANANVGSQVAGVGTGAGGRGTGVNLAATSVFGALTLGRITNNYFINATLTAAAAQGKVKVLSDPKIATLNNVAANINVTTSIPYVTSNVASTGVQTQTVAYALTGIILTVTPTINADGRITLKVNPTVSQPSATAAASTTGAPAVDTRSANTTVVVRDGETIVIGGLISDSVSNQIAKIPLLGDIPILGWLFKKKSVVRNRAELLIFVTPKIID